MNLPANEELMELDALVDAAGAVRLVEQLPIARHFAAGNALAAFISAAISASMRTRSRSQSSGQSITSAWVRLP